MDDDKYIFFNAQMEESAVNPSNGEIVYEFYMSWGGEVDFEIGRKAFADANIVITGGNPSLKLMVRPEHLEVANA
jgi:hypothetical protein